MQTYPIREELTASSGPARDAQEGLDDADLLQRYAHNGDAEAFREIVGRHAGMVYTVCLRIIGDSHAGEDAGQAVFLLLTRKASLINRNTSLLGWLYHSAVFVSREARRNCATRKHHEKEAALMRSSMQLDSDPRQRTDHEPHIYELLECLPAEQRDAIVLRYFCGLSELETSHKLGCPLGTVSARISRGLERLRRRMKGHGTVLPIPALTTLLAAHGFQAAPSKFTFSVQAIGRGQAAPSSVAVALANAVMQSVFRKYAAALTLSLAAVVALMAALLMATPSTKASFQPFATAGSDEKQAKDTLPAGAGSSAMPEAQWTEFTLPHARPLAVSCAGSHAVILAMKNREAILLESEDHGQSWRESNIPWSGGTNFIGPRPSVLVEADGACTLVMDRTGSNLQDGWKNHIVEWSRRGKSGPFCLPQAIWREGFNATPTILNAGSTTWVFARGFGTHERTKESMVVACGQKQLCPSAGTVRPSKDYSFFVPVAWVLDRETAGFFATGGAEMPPKLVHFVTFDSGKSWSETPVAWDSSELEQVRWPEAVFRQGNRLFLVVHSQRCNKNEDWFNTYSLLVSEDLGKTWSEPRTIVADLPVRVQPQFQGIVVVGDALFVAYASGRVGRVLQSNNQGKAWKETVGSFQGNVVMASDGVSVCTAHSQLSKDNTAEYLVVRTFFPDGNPASKQALREEKGNPELRLKSVEGDF